jgi:hypothetical protein
MIVAVAVAAGAAGALAPAGPTGYAVPDAVLNGLLAALIALATSRSRRWSWLWVSALGAVAAGSYLAAAPAAVALALSLWATAVGGRHRVLGAAVGALAAQSLLWVPPLDPYGLSALVTWAAVIPLFVSALRVCPRRVRRRAAYAGGAALVVVVVGLGVLAVAGALASGDVSDGFTEAREGLDAARDADDDLAYRSLSSSAEKFESANDKVSAWWVTPAKLVPGLAQHARALEVATDQGARVATSGADVASSVDVDRLRLEGGRLDLSMVEAVQQPLLDNALVLAEAEAALADVDTHLLAAPLVNRLDRFRDEVARVEPEADLAAEVAAAAPGLLGGEGERRYFVIFTQPAEARGLGGFMGSWAEITAVDGDLTLTRHGRTNELRDTPGAEERTIDGPADYFDRYRRFRPWVVLQDIPLSPDFPQVADVMAQVYPQTGGEEIDGVLAVDPYALAALMEFTGPIDVPELDFDLTSENAADFLTRGQYVEFGADQETREDFLGEVTRETFDRLTTGDLPSPRDVSSTLHDVIEQGRLVLWSRHPSEETLFGLVGATGQVSDREGGDYLSIVTQNSANNKIDAFLHRRVDHQATVDPATGRVRSHVRVELFNDVPDLALPEYVIGSNDQGFPLGTNELWFNVYTPLRFVSAAVDGEPSSLGSEREFDLWAYSQVFQIPRGETLVIDLELEGLVQPGDYRLVVDNQPLVNPDQVRVGVDAAEGWRISSDDLVVEPAGDAASLSYEASRDLVLWAHFRRK